jgi:hypothetical protein
MLKDIILECKNKKIQLSNVPEVVFGAIYSVRFVKIQKGLP